MSKVPHGQMGRQVQTVQKQNRGSFLPLHACSETGYSESSLTLD